MIRKTINPGDSVWVLDEYINTIAERSVSEVVSTGVRIKGYAAPVPFGSLFESENAAIDGMLLRAAAEVRKAAHAYAGVKATLERLRRKYPR